MDTSKKGDMGWKKRRRQVDIMDIFIVCPKFNISLVKYSVLEASFKKVKIWITICLWSKHNFFYSLYFSFVTHGWHDQTSLYIAPSIGNLRVMIQLLMNHYIISDALPCSLVDSIESLKWKQWKSKELGHAPWLTTLWG
jgi:hypothetical protein